MSQTRTPKKPTPKTIQRRVQDEVAKAPIVQIPEALIKVAIPRGKLWPRHLVDQHMSAVESLMMSTTSTTAITRTMRARFGPELTPRRIEDLIRRVRERWLAEDAEARPTNKAAQMRRLQGYLQNARGERNPDGSWKVKPDPGMLRWVEGLMAEIQGTKAPVEVNVDVRIGDALKSVIANMTPEQMGERLAAARERRALAEQARRLLPPIIDVKASQ